MNDTSPTHPAQLSGDKLLADCQVRRTRRSGPGGQHRNKVETAVVITHLPTGVIAEANERRSQRDNHVRAVFRLRVKLATAIRGAANSGPSELWRSRCRAGRIAVNPEHDDFPALLAEALDVLESFGADVSDAAAMLAVTPSQFVKLLALEPAALDRVNAARIAQGLHAWK